MTNYIIIGVLFGAIILTGLTLWSLLHFAYWLADRHSNEIDRLIKCLIATMRLAVKIPRNSRSSGGDEAHDKT